MSKHCIYPSRLVFVKENFSLTKYCFTSLKLRNFLKQDDVLVKLVILNRKVVNPNFDNHASICIIKTQAICLFIFIFCKHLKFLFEIKSNNNFFALNVMAS